MCDAQVWYMYVYWIYSLLIGNNIYGQFSFENGGNARLSICTMLMHSWPHSGVCLLIALSVRHGMAYSSCVTPGSVTAYRLCAIGWPLKQLASRTARKGLTPAIIPRMGRTKYEPMIVSSIAWDPLPPFLASQYQDADGEKKSHCLIRSFRFM